MDVADLVHAADQEREPMKALIRFLLLGATLCAADRWTPLRHPRVGGDPSGSLQRPALGEDHMLLAAAIARRLGDDDVVVQRRLMQNARSVELEDGDAYRGAVSLRLDHGDPIIARRLAQQMRLQLESEARRTEPTEAELRQYLADHADRFTVPERVGVTHVFFSPARRGDRAEEDARRVGTARQPELGEAGDPSLWPARLPLQTADELERIFGAATAAIVAAPLNTWTGPHRSALGYHLAEVVERVPATVPAFETVRAAVRLALLNDRAEQHLQQTLAALR